MPKLYVRPKSVLLTSGQAATFEAYEVINDKENPVAVTWSLSPAIGTLVTPTPAPTLAAATPASATSSTPAPSTKVSSATYVTPVLSASQTVAVIATGEQDSAGATISLTVDSISIIPTKVELKPKDSQQFVAFVAGSPPAPPPSGVSSQPATAPASVKWILSPPFGHLDQEGLYTVPADIPDTMTVNVIAASEATGKQATATVSLSSPPWSGNGVRLLGFYVFLVFSLVFLIVLLWPPALPSPDNAKANRIEAEKNVDVTTADLVKTETASTKAHAELAKLKAASSRQAAAPNTQAAAKPNDNTSVEDAQAEADADDAARMRAGEARDFAAADLKKKRDIEERVNNPDIDTKLAGRINRELDLLWLVLLSGCLGAFLHMSQSFSDYIGNKTLKESWAWWYYFRPFIGAGLALVFYAALRGGIISIATGSNAKASELNPFGIVGVSALVGMFSKAATIKLGEVFDTIFKTDKAQATKDKLTASQSSTDTKSGSSTASATSK